MKFKNGKRADGPSYGYYPEGNIKQIINWKDGEMDGHLVRFYPNGMVTDVFYFSKGIRDGYWYHKLPCGFLESEGEYINGEQIWKKNYKKDA